MLGLTSSLFVRTTSFDIESWFCCLLLCFFLLWTFGSLKMEDAVWQVEVSQLLTQALALQALKLCCFFNGVFQQSDSVLIQHLLLLVLKADALLKKWRT